MRALVALVLVLAAPPASAGDHACADGGPKQKAFAAGSKQGQKLVASAWSNLGGACADRALLESTVREALARLVPPAGASDRVVCRYDGVEDGANAALAAIAATCQGS